METEYSTAFWGEEEDCMSFGADRTGGNLISLWNSVEIEFSPKEERLACQMLLLILYASPSFLRLVYVRKPCSRFLSVEEYTDSLPMIE
ncbi:hypothetical protein AVEN_229132-1 [Araneus ventricosus]|uniref:Uncharacterized protein n=1 Tax=Araneus ventricosus TaxID=182803 RepID=A0A4Y2QN99_ARAVE|nr:hypothetical protein AVEN_229132-1 [Araneus ventricosus]